MDDSELFTWYRCACIVWARANGDADADDSAFKLADPGTGVVAIAAWTSPAPRPTDVQLKSVGVAACEALKDHERVLTYMAADYTLVEASQAQIDAIASPPQGAIVLNTTEGAVQVYLGGMWQSITPVPMDIVFPRVSMAAVPAGSAPSSVAATASPRQRVAA